MSTSYQGELTQTLWVNTQSHRRHAKFSWQKRRVCWTLAGTWQNWSAPHTGDHEGAACPVWLLGVMCWPLPLEDVTHGWNLQPQWPPYSKLRPLGPLQHLENMENTKDLRTGRCFLRAEHQGDCLPFRELQPWSWCPVWEIVMAWRWLTKVCNSWTLGSVLTPPQILPKSWWSGMWWGNLTSTLIFFLIRIFIWS